MRFKPRIKTGCHSSIIIHSYVLNRLRNYRDIQNKHSEETVKAVFLHHRLQLICDSASLIHDQPMSHVILGFIFLFITVSLQLQIEMTVKRNI